MRYIIITGASRGLGKALSEELATENTTLILISRNIVDLIEVANSVKGKGSKVLIYGFDLSSLANIDSLLDFIINSINIDCSSSVIFINNAGTIKPIDKFGGFKKNEIEQNLFTNCITPIIFMNEFIRFTEKMNAERKIINISSGAYNKPISGWSLYSSTKAAVQSIIETISIENRYNGLLKVVSIDPGIMDTDIQQVIREANKNQFNDVDTFINFYREKKLRNPKIVAKIICDNYINNWNAADVFEKLDKYYKSGC